MSYHRPHFPIAVLTHNGALIIAAAKANPEIAARLPDGYTAAAEALCQNLSGEVATQKTAQGALGGLTAGQKTTLDSLHICMAQAQKTARLAFPGQTVKLHQEFQTGPHDHNDVAAYLERCDIVLAAVQNADNLPLLKARGWSNAETTAFQSARAAFGPAEQYRVKSIGAAKGTTAQKNADAATLYESLLTMQNAADMQWPASNPANVAVRSQFRLGVFPPDHGGTGPTKPAPPAPAPEPAK